MTVIANPIYDIVFKYLLEDNKIAKLLISDLIEYEIEELELLPREILSDTKEILSVYLVDFKATIRLSGGERKVVLIEIQKAKFVENITRFRRYLGENYITNIVTEKNKTIALPLIVIYFLGYELENLRGVPIIKVKRQYLNKTTKEVLEVKDEFIESLTHDAIIVQIPAVKKSRRDDLEKALSIFEPGVVHEISIKEEDYPERYRPIIRRLTQAIAKKDLKEKMIIEDDFLNQVKTKEKIIEEKEKELEQERQRAEQERQRAEQERQRAEQERQRAEQERMLKEQKEKELEQERYQIIKNLNKKGFTPEQINEITGICIDEIKKILKK